MDLLAQYDSDGEGDSEDNARSAEGNIEQNADAPPPTLQFTRDKSDTLLVGKQSDKAGGNSKAAALASLPHGFFSSSPGKFSAAEQSSTDRMLATSTPLQNTLPWSISAPNLAPLSEDEEADLHVSLKLSTGAKFPHINSAITSGALGPAKPPELQEGSEEDPTLNETSGMLATLPAPSTSVKKVIKVKLPIQRELLTMIEKDSKSSAEAPRPIKKLKTSSASTLVDFLPAPKNAPSKAELSSKSLTEPTRKGSKASDSTEVRYASASNTDMPGPQYAAFSNEMYRVSDDPYSSSELAGPADQLPTPDFMEGSIYSLGGASTAGAQEQWDPGMYEPTGCYEDGSGDTCQPTAAVGDDDLQQALQAETARALRKGQALKMDEIQFKEINQAQLKHVDTASKETHDALRNALGSEYALNLRAKAAAFTGNKLARRKHQIGTLFHNAKMRELELMENRAAAMKNKAETQGKYGW